MVSMGKNSRSTDVPAIPPACSSLDEYNKLNLKNVLQLRPVKNLVSCLQTCFYQVEGLFGPRLLEAPALPPRVITL